MIYVVDDDYDVRTSLRFLLETEGFDVVTGDFGATVTRSVASELAVWVPSPLEALTTTRSRLPRSAAATVYVAEVAPARSLHAAPALSQRCHW